VVEGRQSLASALTRYHDFNESHRWKFEAMLRVQRTVPRVPPRLLAPALNAMGSKAFVDWSFGHYLQIAPPSFAGPAPAPVPSPHERQLVRAA
jgi:menaquinone-9 beta-reductase